MTMSTRVAINGFGRVGRAAFRAAFEWGRHRVGRDQRYRRAGLSQSSSRDSVYAFPGEVARGTA
jgi:glyceraldehyde-3-phosphate dehydrogenase/erythrose-4-phosphate dehydrogenase